jgi:hypothetical protein
MNDKEFIKIINEMKIYYPKMTEKNNYIEIKFGLSHESAGAYYQIIYEKESKEVSMKRLHGDCLFTDRRWGHLYLDKEQKQIILDKITSHPKIRLDWIYKK